MTSGAIRIWWAVCEAKPQVAHFHDPELIPVGVALKLSGIRVIYDVHEDVPRQILGKHWISPWLRMPVAWLTDRVERLGSQAFDGIVAATPAIAQRFPANKTVTVQNFPILSELVAPESLPYAKRPPHFAYVGGITPMRGAREMIAAVERLANSGARLRLAGKFQPAGLQHELMSERGWGRVEFHGWMNRPEVARLLGNVRGGLVLFHPAPNHLNAQPNKMFEYMAAGLPVVAADFPLWREIVDSAGCGLLVDPLDSAAIADAMRWLLDHPEEAAAMGRRGREAVEQTYNWAPEAQKLIGLYRRLLGEAS